MNTSKEGYPSDNQHKKFGDDFSFTDSEPQATPSESPAEESTTEGFDPKAEDFDFETPRHESSNRNQGSTQNADHAQGGQSTEVEDIPYIEIPASKPSFPKLSDLLAMAGIVILLQIIVTLAVMLFTGNQTGDPLNADLKNRTTMLTYLATMLLANSALLIYCKARGGKLSLFHFGVKRLNPLSLVWAFVMIVLMGIVIEPLMQLLPKIEIGWTVSWWSFVGIVIAAPILEEIMCRGIVLESLRQGRGIFGTWRAWFYSSLFFALIHIQPSAVIYAFFAGLVLGYIYLITNSLWASILVHAANNALCFAWLRMGIDEVSLSKIIANPTHYWIIYGVAVVGFLLSGFLAWRYLKKAEQNQNLTPEE